MKISSKMLKSAVFAFLTVLLVIGIGPSLYTVKAQGDVTVNTLSSMGGTTIPGAGTQSLTSGQSASFVAMPDSGYFFAYWTIVDPSSNVTSNAANPLTLNLTAGTYSIQANFQPLNVQVLVAVPSPNPSSEAVVIVMSGIGGTTSPGPGTYTLANAASLNLVATPLSGWKFDHWVIGGYPLSHGAYSFTDTPTDNPYNVNHGYGYTYSYQPVFSLVSTSSSSSPTPTTPEFPSIAIIGVVIALIAVLLGTGLYAYGKRK
jgi:List-Bact-rpt repeat protein